MSMSPEEVRQMIRDEIRSEEKRIRDVIRNELQSLLGSDRYTFQKHVQFFDGRNMQTGKSTGTKIGTATDQLLGFYGVTPVDQPATVSDANAQGGSYVQADVQSIADAVNDLIDRLQELGLVA